MQININFIPREQNLYFVGGTVRDLMLNRVPRDYDLVAIDDPAGAAERIAASSGGKVVKLGKPDACLYRIVSDRMTCDVTQAREKSITADLTARDFSINAMALSTLGGDIIDPAGGRRDLENRTVRMISVQNLRDDPVRFLRAWRLAAELGFFISADTLSAVHADGRRIAESPGERIRDELIKFFSSAGSSDYIGALAGTPLAAIIFPGMAQLKGCAQNRYHDLDVFDHTVKTYAALETFLNRPEKSIAGGKQALPFFPAPGNRPLLKCAALLHDIGKPRARTVDASGRIHFYGHDQIGADMAADICDALKFSNQQARYITAVIRGHLRPLFLFMQHRKGTLGDKTVNRFFIKADPMVIDLLLLAAADAMGKGAGSDADGFMDFAGLLLCKYIDHYLPCRAAPALINGHDVMAAFHLPPSPLVGEILDYIREQRLQINIRSRQEALDMAKNFLSHRSGS